MRVKKNRSWTDVNETLRLQTIPARNRPPCNPGVIVLCAMTLLCAARVQGDEPPKPESAADIKGNVRSFFGNLGKGIQVNPNRKIVAAGHIDGKGDGVCYEGEKFPVIPHPEPVNVVGGRIQVVLLPCDELIANGVFHPVAPATTSTAKASAADTGTGDNTAVANSEDADCGGLSIPATPAEQKNSSYRTICLSQGHPTGDVVVSTRVLLPGTKHTISSVGGKIQEFDVQNSKYTKVRRPLTCEDLIDADAVGFGLGPRTAKESMACMQHAADLASGQPGGVWGKTDALVAEAKAKADADAAAERERAKGREAREAAFRACRAQAIKSDPATRAQDLLACIDKAKTQN